MGDTYLSVTVDLPEEASEQAQNLMHECGALGLEVRDREAPPMPGNRGPTPGEAIVIGFFDDASDAQGALELIQGEFPQARAVLEPVPTRDWSNEWKALIRSVEVGRLWVGPPWEEEKAPAGKVKLVIEPKMAFGTGDHPTTSLCLAAVDAHLAQFPEDSVLDVGTGTGVLAIAARKLGAGRVVGIDNDEMSVELALENAEKNHAEAVELSGRTLAQIDGTFGLVVANILANTLIELAPAIAAKASNRVVLAGVLAPQRAEVEAAFAAAGLSSRGHAAQGEWVRLDLEKKS